MLSDKKIASHEESAMKIFWRVRLSRSSPWPFSLGRSELKAIARPCGGLLTGYGSGRLFGASGPFRRALSQLWCQIRRQQLGQDGGLRLKAVSGGGLTLQGSGFRAAYDEAEDLQDVVQSGTVRWILPPTQPASARSTCSTRSATPSGPEGGRHRRNYGCTGGGWRLLRRPPSPRSNPRGFG